MKIFLVGFMGSGKTTFGKRLALLINTNFVDTDRFIETQQNMTIVEIFKHQGEAAFREMERKVLLELITRDSIVVSTGGGMPCFNDNMSLMLANGKVIYMKTSPEALAARLINSRCERPLIKGKSKTELLEFIEINLAEREPVYELANITIRTESFSFEELFNLHNKFCRI